MKIRYLSLAYIAIAFSFCWSSCTPFADIYSAETQFYAQKYQSFLEKSPTGQVVKATINSTFESDKSKGKYIYKQYHPQKEILMNYTEYKDNFFKKKHGKHVLYGDDGRIIEKGRHLNDQKISLWQELSQKGNYVNGKRHGIWYSFNMDKMGNLTDAISKTEYQNGIQIKTTTLNNSIEFTHPYLPVCAVVSTENRRMCTEKNLLKELYGNIVYPDFARANIIQGLTLTTFIIDKNGQIKDVEVLRSICNQMEDEVKRVIRLLPKFEPGTMKGKKVDTRYNMPINFKLN